MNGEKRLNLQTHEVAPQLDFKKLKLAKRWTREGKIVQNMSRK